MRRVLISLAAVAAISSLGFVLTRGPARVHISGDLSTDLSHALVERLPGAIFAEHVAQAKIEIVAVTEWEKLTFVPGALEMCADDCLPSSKGTIVRIIRIGVSGVRKHVYLNISPFLSDANADVFALSDQGKACLGIILALEITDMRPDSWPAECLSNSAVVSRLKLGVS